MRLVDAFPAALSAASGRALSWRTENSLYCWLQNHDVTSFLLFINSLEKIRHLEFIVLLIEDIKIRLGPSLRWGDAVAIVCAANRPKQNRISSENVNTPY